MSRWTAFLNSLATRGGAILILLGLTCLSVAVTLFVVWRGWDTSMVIGGLISSLGNFTGALLLGLKGSSDQTPPPMVSQQVTTTSSSAMPPETPKV